MDSETEQAFRHLDLAGWSALVDCLIAGACHDLNGRSAALFGLSQLAAGGEDQEFVVETLDTEARRIQTLSGGLKAISARGNHASEPIALNERLPGLAQLFRIQPGGEWLTVAVDVDPQAPAVFAPWSLLGRYILLLMAAATGIRLRDHSRVALSLRYDRADSGSGQLSIWATGDASGEPDPGMRHLAERFASWPEPLDEALASFGCSVPRSPGTGGGNTKEAEPLVEVRLPSLSRS